MSFADFIRQLSILMGLPFVLALGLAAATIVVVRDWRAALLAYGLLSVLLALLLTQGIPMEWALMQAIVGGLVAVMLFLSAGQLRGVRPPAAGREGRWPQLASLTSFRLLAVALLAGAFFTAHSELPALPAVGSPLSDAIVWLVLMGVMGLALHEEPLHAGLALLVVLAGFMLLFFPLTRSRVIIGLLDSWQLLLGLAISYLTVSRGLAGVETGQEGPAFRWRQ
jgi:hypothetical protein